MTCSAELRRLRFRVEGRSNDMTESVYKAWHRGVLAIYKSQVWITMLWTLGR